MINKRKPYKTFTREFKVEAVRMMRESDRSASEIARELGVRRNQLYKWEVQLEAKGNAAFKGRGRPKKEDQSDFVTLKQENVRLREEVAILKKAAVYFAKELKGSIPLSRIIVPITRLPVWLRCLKFLPVVTTHGETVR